MKNLKNFFNPVLNDNRLFTAEDIGRMTPEIFAANEQAINYQINNLGIPRNADLARNRDIVYVQAYTKNDGTRVQAHYRSKPDNIADKTTNIKRTDIEFNRTLNYQIKGRDSGIPNYKNYEYYNNLSNKLDHEVGDFLQKNTNAPQVYSNDIRHQYVSAIFARNLGEKQAKWLGDINEWFHFGRTGSGTEDTNIDQLNNEIGRKYGLKYPNTPREELLKILLKDWEKNSQYTKEILNKRF